MKLTLRFPFSWQERAPCIYEGVLFVPKYYSDHVSFGFPAWNDSQLFGNDQPVKIEYCSGNGEWIIHQALKHPDINWIAVEQRFDRLRKIWSKARNRDLKNLFLVCGEAAAFSHYYLPPSSVAGAYINFPDPWPKARHAKHRLIHSDFLNTLAHIFVPEASLTLVTDDANYLEQSIALLKEHSHFSPVLDLPFYTAHFPDYGTSYFDTLWREKGKNIFYTQWSKKCLS